MIWELIATVVAGVGAAGIGLFLHRMKPTLFPRYLVPFFAGAGMLGFLIYGEYSWFKHNKSRLPVGVEVVRVIDGTTWWRPWSFLVPHQLQFVALDTNTRTANAIQPEFVLIDLFFFEHRQPTRMLRQIVDCQRKKRTLFREQLVLPQAGAASGPEWQALAEDDKIFQLSCLPAKTK
jgi:hypothetical protein